MRSDEGGMLCAGVFFRERRLGSARAVEVEAAYVEI
jgi:hypothetical protein